MCYHTDNLNHFQKLFGFVQGTDEIRYSNVHGPMDLQEVGRACGDWTELAQDKDRWQALVSTVMSLQVPKMRGNI